MVIGCACCPPGQAQVNELPLPAINWLANQLPAGSVIRRTPAAAPLKVHVIWPFCATTSCGPPLSVTPNADCAVPSYTVSTFFVASVNVAMESLKQVCSLPCVI